MSRIAVERAVAAALIGASFLAGYAWRGRSTADHRPAEAGARSTSSSTPSPGTGATNRDRSAAARAAAGSLSAEDLRQQLGTVFREPSLAEKFIQLAGVLQRLSRDNWRGALQAFTDARQRGEENPDAWALFVRRAGEVVGQEVVTYFVDQNDLDAARSALTGWASTNPVAALDWISKQAAAETRQQIMGAAIRGLALSEPDLAVNAIEGISIERRKNYVWDLVPAIVRGAGLAQAEEIVNGIIRRAAANGQAGDDYVKRIFADFAEAKIRRAAVSGDVTGLADWVKAHVNQPYAPDDTVLVWGTAAQLAQTDVPRALAWLDALHAAGPVGDPTTPMGYGVVLMAWREKEGSAAVTSWLAANTNNPRYDQIVSQYTKQLAGADAAEANRLTATMKNAALRATAQKTVAEIAARSRPR